MKDERGLGMSVMSKYLKLEDFQTKEELELFNAVMYKLNPRNSGDIYEDVFNAFFNAGCKKPIFNKTLHENIFSVLFPHLEPQVSFGVGKGNYKKYLAKKFVADFYDKDTKTIWEIDGENHKEEVQKLKDQRRDLFFKNTLGIETVRVTNKKVEEILLKRISMNIGDENA